jgi:FixJ family two-component response regulator
LTTAVEAIKAGASDFIIKPLMHDEMKRAVRKALDKPGS